MQHIIRGETDACYQSLDGILKGEHQDGRSGTKTSKERGRTLVDDDGNHHNHTDKDHHDLQHATDTIKILLTGGTGTVFQLTEGVDEHDDRADSHDGKVDRCQTAYNVFQNTWGSSTQMTIAGMMRLAEFSTRSLKMTSSHSTSVLRVIFSRIGTTNCRQSQPANHASTKAETTKMP